jgi:uncharacterized repeat protein (TIGR01451 family)
MKKLIYIFLLLFGFNSLDAQGWYTFYDQYPSAKAEVVIQVPNGNYIIAGSFPTSFVNNDLFLAEISKNGDVASAKLDYDLRLFEISKLSLTDDGGLVLLGSRKNSTKDLVVIRFNGDLEIEWEKVLPSQGTQEIAKELLIDDKGNLLIYGVLRTAIGQAPIFAKLDVDGNIIWHTTGNFVSESSGVAFDSNGNILTTGKTLDNELFVGIYDPEYGVGIDMRLYVPNPMEEETGYEVIAGLDGHFYLISKYTRFNADYSEVTTSHLRMREVDALGSIIEQKDFNRLIEPEQYIKTLRMDDGTFTYCFRAEENFDRYYIQLVHLDSDMETELWVGEYADISPEMELANDFIATRDGGYMVAGFIQSDNHIPLLLRVDENGLAYTNEIYGNVFKDDDNNCTYSSTESHLSDWMVEIKGDGEVYYRMADENGHYSISVGIGTYEVRAVPPSDVWVECPATTVSFDDFFLSAERHTPAQPLFDCPVMSVDINTGSLRRCYERHYTVQYCNLGTQGTDGVYIEVEIDSQLQVTGASIPITAQEGNLLTFDIGNVAYNECGSFLISIFTPCSVILGDIHCSTAHIYPDAVCEDALNWTGAEVRVTGECMDDNTIHFEIKNVGAAPMQSPRLFHIIEDEMVLMTGTFDLLPGQTHPIDMPATGGVYRLAAEQELDFPGNSAPSVIVPGCGGFFDSSYMNWYPMDDSNLFEDISCMENVDSYDPNDKQAEPGGYAEDHYIEANTTLEYFIRFQNTGTDTAYNVLLEDPISALLDITTFKLGVTSHPCEVEIDEINGKHVLKFHFKDIDLLPLIIDEPNSSGFIKFTIDQVPDLAINSRIENKAHIYFDFNEAIITNQTHHTIGADFMVVFENPIEEEHILNLKGDVLIQPNPITDKTLITLPEEYMDQSATFSMYSADCKLVRNGFFMSGHIWVEKHNLSDGMYFYKIVLGNGEQYYGKLMVR